MCADGTPDQSCSSEGPRQRLPEQDDLAQREVHATPAPEEGMAQKNPASRASAAGTAKFRAGDFQKAAHNYSLALRLSAGQRPACAAILSNRSAAHAKLGQWEKALEDADRAVKLGGTCAKYLCRRGAALVGLGQAGEAVKVYQEAAKLEPEYAGAHSGLHAAKQAVSEAQRRYEAMWGK